MAQQDQIIIDVSQVQNQDEMQHLLKLFPKKLLLTFSFLQLFFGFFVSKLDNYITINVHKTTSFSQVIGIMFRSYRDGPVYVWGIWTGLMFCVSGGVGVIGGFRPSKAT